MPISPAPGPSLDAPPAVAWDGSRYLVLERGVPAVLWELRSDGARALATDDGLAGASWFSRLFAIGGVVHALCDDGDEGLYHAIFDGAQFVRVTHPAIPFGRRALPATALDPARGVIVLVDPVTGDIFEYADARWRKAGCLEIGWADAIHYNEVVCAWDRPRKAIVILHNKDDMTEFTTAVAWDGAVLRALPSPSIPCGREDRPVRGGSHPVTGAAIFLGPIRTPATELGPKGFAKLASKGAPLFGNVGELIQGPGTLEAWGASVSGRAGGRRVRWDGKVWSDEGEADLVAKPAKAKPAKAAKAAKAKPAKAAKAKPAKAAKAAKAKPAKAKPAKAAKAAKVAKAKPAKVAKPKAAKAKANPGKAATTKPGASRTSELPLLAVGRVVHLELGSADALDAYTMRIEAHDESGLRVAWQMGDSRSDRGVLVYTPRALETALDRTRLSQGSVTLADGDREDAIVASMPTFLLSHTAFRDAKAAALTLPFESGEQVFGKVGQSTHELEIGGRQTTLPILELASERVRLRVVDDPAFPLILSTVEWGDPTVELIRID